MNLGFLDIGEAIARLLARALYGWLDNGRDLQEALDAVIALFEAGTEVDLIGVTATAHGCASNRARPTATREFQT